jgi:ferredoxin
MKTVIYYFTGTGNSLAAARCLSRGIENCELVSIASLSGNTGEIIPAADRVGIVCPVYFTGLPVMVSSFASRLNLCRSGYTFAVVTMGGSGGSSALRQLDTIIAKRSGQGLDAGFMVKMPGNYILMYESPRGAKRETILAAADLKLAEITAAVTMGLKVSHPFSPLAELLHRLFYPGFARHVHEDDRKFSVAETCTSCGICAAVCPARNIEIRDGRPFWLHRCELCCACIHVCPVRAIEAGRSTIKRERYRNNSVTIADLKKQRGE